jgi:hypothetical protein
MAMARKLPIDVDPEFPEQMIYENDSPVITKGTQKYLDLCRGMAESELKIDDPDYTKLMGELDVAWEELSDDEKRVSQQVLNQEVQAKQAAAIAEALETPLEPEIEPELDELSDTDRPPPPETKTVPDAASEPIKEESDDSEIDAAFASVTAEPRKLNDDSEDIDDDPGDEEE